MKFKKVLLKEIANSQTGPFGSQLHEKDYVDEGTPIVTVEHLGETGFLLQNLPLVSDFDKNRLSKYILREGDIVFSRVGSIDRCTFVSKKEDGWMFSGRCIRIRCNEKVNSKYLNFYFRLSNFKKMMLNISVGATMPSLNTSLMDTLPLFLPELKYQEKIAAVLSALDAKIELNNRINAELDTMAKTLYDYWFVQFDFPDENGKPYKSSGGKMVYNQTLKREIPEGWKVNPIVEHCTIVDCLHSKKPDYNFESENYYLLQLENIRDDGLIDISNKYYVSKKDYQVWTSRIELKESDLVITNAGRVAANAQIYSGLATGLGRNITAIRPSSILPNYLFLSFRGLDTRRQIAWNTSDGAFFKSFNVKSIKLLSILKPPKKYELEFEAQVTPISLKRHQIIKENQQLTQLRDWLLPMLMNGQVTVK